MQHSAELHGAVKLGRNCPAADNSFAGAEYTVVMLGGGDAKIALVLRALLRGGKVWTFKVKTAEVASAMVGGCRLPEQIERREQLVVGAGESSGQHSRGAVPAVETCGGVE